MSKRGSKRVLTSTSMIIGPYMIGVFMGLLKRGKAIFDVKIGGDALLMYILLKTFQIDTATENSLQEAIQIGLSCALSRRTGERTPRTKRLLAHPQEVFFDSNEVIIVAKAPTASSAN
ncbi:hypothetical protein EGR_08008 [Echinococcus granulosus]|uniref:Uncharacterized protein n=1 Tax=Echinococcus granulosus TaxID=6210 RepID=W6UUQ2_ECHGR|nr:hypothetical protein EGR_08008 [Echinococcus granulosus]EUB57124.1 hypothetical protein EGR_08008 [Echinococcus granulosus]